MKPFKYFPQRQSAISDRPLTVHWGRSVSSDMGRGIASDSDRGRKTKGSQGPTMLTKLICTDKK